MSAESTAEVVGQDEEVRGMSRWLQLGLGLLVVLGGVGVAAGLIASQGAEEKGAVEAPTTPVEVVVATPSVLAAQLESTGTVVAARQVSVVPQVGGQITDVSERLQPGGRFAAGEVLARIDSRDYALAVEQRRSTVQQAEVELRLEQGRQETARREWVLLGNSGDPPELAARRPQLQAAELSLASARSQLKTAELQLERTALRAPFNAMVTAESLEKGQVVGTGGAVATLVGTDALWVQVSVPVEHLPSLDIPGVNAEEGSAARVIQDLGSTAIEREGRVLRLAGTLDEQSRTATVLVEIDDPLNLQAEAAGGLPGLPLLPGAFVRVTLEGRSVSGAVSVPRIAVEDNQSVWLAQDGKLTRRSVRVGWGDDASLVVVDGLDDGEQIVVTPMSFPLEGMAVSVAAGGQ